MERGLSCTEMTRYVLLFCVLAALAGCGDFTTDGDSTSIGKAQKMELFLTEDNLLRLYSSVSTNESFSCTVIYENGHFDGKIKVRGYTSRMHPKKSFQLKVDGKKYVLERGDEVAGISNRIAMRAHQLAGLPACDTETIGLFLNDEYLGCYNFITYYDEDILGGELYKSYFENYDHMENNHPLRSLSEKKFPEESFESTADREKAINDYLDEFEEQLTSEENPAKTLTTGFSLNESGKAEEKWVIERLENEIKAEDRLSTSAAANSEILFSLMVNPSVLGAGMPGGPYAGNVP